MDTCWFEAQDDVQAVFVGWLLLLNAFHKIDSTGYAKGKTSKASQKLDDATTAVLQFLEGNREESPGLPLHLNSNFVLYVLSVTSLSFSDESYLNLTLAKVCVRRVCHLCFYKLPTADIGTWSNFTSINVESSGIDGFHTRKGRNYYNNIC
uniref:Uncharacterized protein n=1 Tax=Glossina palpalis gambiensis TaxID=67801 RepID=A0A1B0AT22_9MUSC